MEMDKIYEKFDSYNTGLLLCKGRKASHQKNRYLHGRIVMRALSELDGDDSNGEGSRTFVFIDESHTLGNGLKSIISRYADVQFCGYTIPHPAENKMHFRVQTISRDIRAIDVLKRGLEDLEKICDHTIQIFEKEVNDFNKT